MAALGELLAPRPALQALASPRMPATTRAARPSAQVLAAWVNTLFRRPVFDDTDAARAVARVHRQSGPWSASRCLAWVLLPDRWQVLLELAPGDAVERIVQRFKSASAKVVDPRCASNGWLWERGFDGQLLAEGSERQVARQLVLEPVRAGLAGCIGEYPTGTRCGSGEPAPTQPLERRRTARC
jgi:REP element-mobilizing transposase RayT